MTTTTQFAATLPPRSAPTALHQPERKQRPGWLDVARAGLFFVLEAVRAEWRAFVDDHFPECYVGEWCSVCEDVHREGEICQRQLVGFCVECDRDRVLTRAGNCLSCSSGSILNRRFLDAARTAVIGRPPGAGPEDPGTEEVMMRTT